MSSSSRKPACPRRHQDEEMWAHTCSPITDAQTHTHTHSPTQPHTHTPTTITSTHTPQPRPHSPPRALAHVLKTVTLWLWDHCCGNRDSAVLTSGRLDPGSEYSISHGVCALNSESFPPQRVRPGSQAGSWQGQAILGLITFCLSDGVAHMGAYRRAVSAGLSVGCACAHDWVRVRRSFSEYVAAVPESAAPRSVRPGQAGPG